MSRDAARPGCCASIGTPHVPDPVVRRAPAPSPPRRGRGGAADGGHGGVAGPRGRRTRRANRRSSLATPGGRRPRGEPRTMADARPRRPDANRTRARMLAADRPADGADRRPPTASTTPRRRNPRPTALPDRDAPTHTGATAEPTLSHRPTGTPDAHVPRATPGLDARAHAEPTATPRPTPTPRRSHAAARSGGRDPHRHRVPGHRPAHHLPRQARQGPGPRQVPAVRRGRVPHGVPAAGRHRAPRTSTPTPATGMFLPLLEASHAPERGLAHRRAGPGLHQRRPRARVPDHQGPSPRPGLLARARCRRRQPSSSSSRRARGPAGPCPSSRCSPCPSRSSIRHSVRPNPSLILVRATTAPDRGSVPAIPRPGPYAPACIW